MWRRSPEPERTGDRLASAVAVVAIHAALGWLLLSGAGVRLSPDPIGSLATFDVTPDPPPPEPKPAPKRDSAASPENLRARPKPVVAPPPVVTLPPPPLAAAPIASTGADANAGAGDRPGLGTGAGGIGSGLGSGGGATRAVLVSGVIRAKDYPRAERKARVTGAVTVRFTVEADGYARDCAVDRSSGSAALDAATCRLIEDRYRYRPARDASGEPVAELRGWRQDWWLEPPR